MREISDMKNEKYFVLHETRIGTHGIHPQYYAYGPYASDTYARKIVRDLAQTHGGHVWAGMNEYTHERYFHGLLNWHRVSVVSVPVPAHDEHEHEHGYYTRDSKGHEINLSDLAKSTGKYRWK